jgi:hypothetical protein
MRTTSTIIVIFWLCTAALPAFADDCVDKLTPSSLYTEVFPCLKDQLKTVATFQKRLQDLNKPATVSIVTASRTLGQVFANTTGKTMIVIVTAFNNTKGNTMCGNVAASTEQLPTDAHGGKPTTTTVQSSFIDDKFSASMTFVVPAGHFYSVTTDGGAETLIAWTEVTL